MKKGLLFFLIFLTSFVLFSQEETIEGLLNEEKTYEKKNAQYLDETSYDKTTDFEERKAFDDDLKTKYSDSDFIYTEKKTTPPKKTSKSNVDFSFLKGFISFIQVIFPFLIGFLIIYIVIKVFFGAQMGFWNVKKVSKNIAERLVFEENEDIHKTDFEKLLKKAIEEKENRLATRYFYLLILRSLSEKEFVKYHKEKTNADYLIEIKNKEIRKSFSQISYIYNYVWYGEFEIDASQFEIIKEKYNSLRQLIR